MAFPLSLRPVARKATGDDQESLQYLIQRINEERGHFRNITEESLRQEIDALESVDSKLEDDTAPEEKPQDVEARRKEIYAARADMLKFIK